MGIVDVEYTVTETKVVEVEKIEKRKTASVRCCDVCKVPCIEYVELEGSIYNGKQTGRRSPVNIFSYCTQVGHPVSMCFQCRKDVCEKCRHEKGDVWTECDGCGDHVGTIYLCDECDRNQNGVTQQVLGYLRNIDTMKENLERLNNDLKSVYGDVISGARI